MTSYNCFLIMIKGDRMNRERMYMDLVIKPIEDAKNALINAKLSKSVEEEFYNKYQNLLFEKYKKLETIMEEEQKKS